jgi:hypothetical protein
MDFKTAEAGQHSAHMGMHSYSPCIINLDYQTIIKVYSFDSALVASTKLFLPPKPNRYAATFRI